MEILKTILSNPIVYLPWLIIIPVILLATFINARREAKKESPSYEKKESILTKNEMSFFRALKDAADKRYLVFGQVALNQILKAKGGDNSARMSAFNKIRSKSVDFALLDPETLKTVALIELDDASHNKTSRIKRDEFMNKTMKDCELPLIRFKAKRGGDYTSESISETINKALFPATE